MTKVLSMGGEKYIFESVKRCEVLLSGEERGLFFKLFADAPSFFIGATSLGTLIIRVAFSPILNGPPLAFAEPFVFFDDVVLFACHG